MIWWCFLIRGSEISCSNRGKRGVSQFMKWGSWSPVHQIVKPPWSDDMIWNEYQTDRRTEWKQRYIRCLDLMTIWSIALFSGPGRELLLSLFASHTHSTCSPRSDSNKSVTLFTSNCTLIIPRVPFFPASLLHACVLLVKRKREQNNTRLSLSFRPVLRFETKTHTGCTYSTHTCQVKRSEWRAHQQNRRTLSATSFPNEDCDSEDRTTAVTGTHGTAISMSSVQQKKRC